MAIDGPYRCAQIVTALVERQCTPQEKLLQRQHRQREPSKRAIVASPDVCEAGFSLMERHITKQEKGL